MAKLAAGHETTEKEIELLREITWVLEKGNFQVRGRWLCFKTRW